MSKASDVRERPNSNKPPTVDGAPWANLDLSRRDVLKLAGYGSLAAFLAACSLGGGGTTRESTTVSLGIQTIAYGKRKTLLSDWEQASGNKVAAEVIDDQQFDQLLSTKLLSEDLWDVFIRYTGAPSMLKYRPDLHCLDLSHEPWVSRVSSGVLPYITYSDGKVYAMPSGAPGTLAVVYSKKVFADLGLTPPTTMTQLYSVLDAVKGSGKGIAPVYVGAKDGWPLSVPMGAAWPNMAAAHPGLADKLNKNQIKWSEVPEFRAFLDMLYKFAKSGYYNKDLSAATYDSTIQALGEGTAAIAYLGDFAYDPFHKRYPNAELGIFAQPSAGGNPSINITGPGGFYISKKSKHAAAARDLLNYLASPTAQSKLLATEPGVSLYKDVPSNPANPLQQAIQPYLTSGKVQPHWNDVYLIPYAGDMDQIFGLLVKGQKTPDEVAAAFDSYCQKIGRQLALPGF